MENILRQIANFAIKISLAKNKQEVFYQIDEILKLIENKTEFNEIYINLINLKKKYECS
jgi:hypothetical protein